MKTKATRGQWSPSNLSRLDSMLQRAQSGQYAIVDWDNTSIFRDIEDAVLAFQCENMRFAIHPLQMEEVLLDDLPEDCLGPDCKNRDGDLITASALAHDIATDYKWAHLHPRTARTSHPRMLAFKARLRFFYEALDQHMGHTASCIWITRLFAGMSAQQVHELTRDAIRYHQKLPIARARWEVPHARGGKTGRVVVTWSQGLRAMAAMQELYAALEERGVSVYVVSASFGEIVREFASNAEHGYGLGADHVFGMRSSREEELFTHRPLAGVSHTQAEGKVRTIETEIMPLYGFEPPLLVAGDSNGDAPMLEALSDADTRLIFNRVLTGKIGNLSERALSEDAILLQGRDESRGVLRPSSSSILLGETRERLLAQEVDEIEEVA